MLEEEAGDDNAGVRLALYFQRKAETITSPYDILADDALFEVFKVIYQLPDEIGSVLNVLPSRTTVMVCVFTSTVETCERPTVKVTVFFCTP